MIGKKPKHRKLRAQQQKFVEEYLIDLNATQAAIRAKYSPKTARFQASVLLTRPNIQAAIQKAKQKRAEKTGVTAAMVVKEQANLGLYNISEYYNEDGSAKQLFELTRDQLAAVKSFKRVAIQPAEGTEEEIKYIITDYFFHGKDKALESLSKHTGIYEEDNLQKGNAELMTRGEFVEDMVDSLKRTTGLPKPRDKKK